MCTYCITLYTLLHGHTVVILQKHNGIVITMSYKKDGSDVI